MAIGSCVCHWLFVTVDIAADDVVPDAPPLSAARSVVDGFGSCGPDLDHSVQQDHPLSRRFGASMAVTLRSSSDRMRRLFNGKLSSTTRYGMATRHCWRIVER